MARPGTRWLGLLVGVALAAAGAAVSSAQDEPAEGTDGLIGNRTTKTYHKKDCAAVKKLAARSKVALVDPAEAKSKGFKPCPVCKPPLAEEPKKEGDPDPEKAAPEDPDDETKKATPVKGKGRSSSKRGSSKGKAGPAAKTGTAKKGAGEEKGIKFSRDIAPILVANCSGCHNAQQKRKNLNMASFQGLMAGGADGKVIAPGNPDESMLIQRVRGEETPKMPPGQRNLAPETITKLEEWIKAGAILDAGVDPGADMKSYAPTPEELKQAEIARMPSEERDKKTEAAGRERWKKANSKEPEITVDRHFLMLSNVPPDRAKNILKSLETQYATLTRLLGPLANKTALAGPEKIGVYLFTEPNAYAEFVRGVENQEVEAGGTQVRANFSVESPYLVAVDTLFGGEDAAAPAAGEPAKKKSGRAKKSDADAGEPDGQRNIIAVLAEQLGTATMSQVGKSPQGLRLGIGTWLGAQVEGRHTYYGKLRGEAYDCFAQGRTVARAALGGDGEPDRVRGVGLSLIEFLASSSRNGMPYFLREVANDPANFDQAAKEAFGASPEDFLNGWSRFVAARYGRGR